MMQSLLDQPSAVGHMLSLLASQPPAGQPGQPPPMPAAPMPLPDVPMQPQQPQQSLLGKMHDYLSDRLGIKAPGGYEGLLSSDEIRQAKPGILASLGGDTYASHLDHLVAIHQIAAGLAEHKRVMESRSNMPQDLSLPDQLKYAAQHGDMEMIKALGGPLEGMLGAKPADAAKDIKEVPGIGAVDFSDPKHPQIVMASKDKPTVPNYSAVPGIDPETGKPTVFTLNTKTGKMESTGVGKPVAGAAGQNAPQMAAAKANMQSAMKIMDEYEAKLKQNPKLYGTLEATLGAAASSPTALTAQHPWDLPMSLVGNNAAAHMMKSNPELMRYMTAKKLIAEALLNTHKRPNQTQYEIEQELGGVGPNPSAMQIDMVAARRNRMYQEVFANPEAGAVGGAAPKTTQSYEDWKKSKGHN